MCVWGRVDGAKREEDINSRRTAIGLSGSPSMRAPLLYERVIGSTVPHVGKLDIWGCFKVF